MRKLVLIFVRFEYEHVSRPGKGVARPGTHPAADDGRRIFAGGSECLGEHGGGRGLAMRPGDEQAHRFFCQLPDGFWIRKDPQSEFTGAGNLDVRRECGRIHDEIDIDRDVIRRKGSLDGYALFLENGRVETVPGVRSGNVISDLVIQCRERRCAGTFDTDDINTPHHAYSVRLMIPVAIISAAVGL